MILNINSPAYYTNVYGVDEDVYKACSIISEYFRDKNYGEAVDTIGIVPIIAPKDEIINGLWEECSKVEIRYGYASVSLQIDFDEFIGADANKKKELIRENIDKSIRKISRKIKIDYKSFSEELKLIEL